MAVQGKWIRLAGLGGVALLSACGTASDSAVSQGSVVFSIEGTRPDSLTSALTASASRALGALSELAVPSRSGLATSETEVALPVSGTGGTQIGVLTLSDARVVLKEIKLKTLEERESEDEAESESEDSSDDSAQRFARSGGDDDGGDDSSDSSSDSEDNIKFRGPYIVDLIRNESTPSFSTIEIPVGDYREIELKLHKVDGSEENDEGVQAVATTDALYENSIVLSGTYTPTAGSAVSFSFTYDLSEEFELSGAAASQGFTVAEGEDNPIVVAFRMAQWLDFTGASKDLSNLAGNIALDETASGDSSTVRELIRDNVKSSADYGKDEDGDGHLGKDEDDDSDESGEDENDD